MNLPLNKKVILAFVGAVIVLLGIAVFYLDRGYIPFLQNPPFDLSGGLYLTLTPKGQSTPLQSYVYDLKERTLKEFPLGEGENITTKISPDGTALAFAKARPQDDYMQLFLSDTRTGKLRQLTDDTVTFKREPTWSAQNDQLAYITAELPEGEERDPHLPESWNIYVTDLEGNTRFITEGYNPLFSPNGDALLLLKNDGLYLYALDEDNSAPQKVWPVLNELANSHMKLTLSHDPDKTVLAWTNHHASPDGELILFNVNSWEPFEMRLVHRIKRSAIFTAFSPDFQYLAVEVADPVPNETGRNLHIAIYDLETLSTEYLLDLNEFNGDFMWLTDWR